MLKIDCLEELASIPSVTCFEKPMLTRINKYCHYPNHIKIIDNKYIAFVAKISNGILITIHIDRLGLIYDGNIITYSNYFGYEQLHRSYKPNLKFGKRFLGKTVQAYDPRDGKILAQGIVNDCRITSDDNLSFNVVGPDWYTPMYPLPIQYLPDIKVTEREIIGQIDNVLSVYLGLALIKSKTKFSIIFTTEEEIGISWKYIDNFLEKYKYTKILLMDTTNIEGLTSLYQTDVVFRVSDDVTDFGTELVSQLIETGNRCKINYFIKEKSRDNDKIKNITEIGRLINNTNQKIQAATVQIPSINYHSVYETTTVNAVIKIYQFLKYIDNGKMAE